MPIFGKFEVTFSSLRSAEIASRGLQFFKIFSGSMPPDSLVGSCRKHDIKDIGHPVCRSWLKACTPDILFVVIETFLDDTYAADELDIPGFMLFLKDRFGKRGGGILAYVHLSIPIHRRLVDLECKELETLWLEVNHERMKPILVTGIYRPPDSDASTDSKMETNLLQECYSGNEFYVFGNFNINMFDPSALTHEIVQDLHGMTILQLVSATTRPGSGTCLDHIWASTEDNVLQLLFLRLGSRIILLCVW